jgi:hypothetical protein
MAKLLPLSMFTASCLMTLSAFSQQVQEPNTPPLTFTTSLPMEKDEPRATPPLFFREQWKTTSGQHFVTQADVANPNLELHLLGPSGKDIQLNDDHLWTGNCAQNCGMALRDKHSYVDLRGAGQIRWLTRQAGLNQVHAIIKLADGTWLVSEHAETLDSDRLPSAFTLSDSRWIQLDINRLVTHGRWLDHPDLSRVDEIGFSTLMPGSGHGYGGYADLGWFEVYGAAVPRSGAAPRKP